MLFAEYMRREPSEIMQVVQTKSVSMYKVTGLQNQVSSGKQLSEHLGEISCMRNKISAERGRPPGLLRTRKYERGFVHN